jgi:hypothetical protein
MNSELDEKVAGGGFEVVAERALKAAIDEKVLDVQVRFGKPILHPEGDWVCPYQIIGIGSQTWRWIGGIDAVEALQLAMYAAGADLSRNSKGTKLTFLDDSDLGFPSSAREATGSCPYCRS